MKLRPLLILLVVVSLTASANSQTVSDRERDGLKGPVQTVRVKQTTTTEENGDITQTPLLITQIVTYDKSGNRTEVAFYDKNGLLARKIVNTYDSSSKKKSGSITYDSNNTMVRRIVDSYGKNGLEKKRTIEDFNEDGSLYKKVVLALNSFGDVIEFAEYGADGVLIKTKETAPNEGERQMLVAGLSQEADRVVSFARSAKEYFEPDAHGNWTRGSPSSTSRKYESGRKTKTTETVYREITYYQN